MVRLFLLLLLVGLMVRSYAAAFTRPIMTQIRHRGLADVASAVTSTSSLDFEFGVLAPNMIAPLKWSSTGAQVSRFGYRIGLEGSVTKKLQQYCNDSGVKRVFKSLLVDNRPMACDSNTIYNHKWLIQRPGFQWASNAHWISPVNEEAHDAFLQVLSEGGFDDTLESIGEYFGFDGLVAYQLSFIGVSQCNLGYMHFDFEKVSGNGFNLIIPLILADDATPELDVRQSDDIARIGKYKYTLDEAIMVGDEVGHATAACNYLDARQMRVAVTVYVADVKQENANQLASYLTQHYPPPGDADHLLARAGNHWKLDDPMKQLPTGR